MLEFLAYMGVWFNGPSARGVPANATGYNNFLRENRDV